MLEARLHGRATVHELDAHVQHLGDEVSVREPATAERPASLRVDGDRDPTDERLQPDRRLDRPREGGGRALRNRDAEVLVEDPPELDARLKEEPLPP